MSEITPYAWHYYNNGGASVWHRGPSNRLDADAAASKTYPAVHKLIALYDASTLAAKDAEIADMLTTICEQQDEIEALRERECALHDAYEKWGLGPELIPAIEAIAFGSDDDCKSEIARLRDLVKRLADRLVTRGHSERSQEYCTDCALVAEARKESP